MDISGVFTSCWEIFPLASPASRPLEGLLQVCLVEICLGKEGSTGISTFQMWTGCSPAPLRGRGGANPSAKAWLPKWSITRASPAMMRCSSTCARSSWAMIMLSFAWWGRRHPRHPNRLVCEQKTSLPEGHKLRGMTSSNESVCRPTPVFFIVSCSLFPDGCRQA